MEDFPQAVQAAAEAIGAPIPPAGFLTRDALLAAPDIEYDSMEVPEWGGSVRLKMLTSRERDAYEASCLRKRHDGTKEFDARNVRAKLVALCLVDEAGNRLLQEEDIAALGRKSAKALSRVFDRCSAMNGLGAEDVKSLEGTSGQDDDSDTGSPWPSDER